MRRLPPFLRPEENRSMILWLERETRITATTSRIVTAPSQTPVYRRFLIMIRLSKITNPKYP